MCLPKAEDGMNLPNLRHYNIACLLRHACDWLSRASQLLLGTGLGGALGLSGFAPHPSFEPARTA